MPQGAQCYHQQSSHHAKHFCYKLSAGPSCILCIAGQPLYLSSVDTYQIPLQQLLQNSSSFFKLQILPLFSPRLRKSSPLHNWGDNFTIMRWFESFSPQSFSSPTPIYTLLFSSHPMKEMPIRNPNAKFLIHIAPNIGYPPIFVHFLHHTGMFKPCQSKQHFVIYWCVWSSYMIPLKRQPSINKIVYK